MADKGALEACLIATPPLVRHCWQSNSRTPTGERKQELLIPPADGTVAAVLLTGNHGDLLLSLGQPKGIAHSFTERNTLFEGVAKSGPR